MTGRYRYYKGNTILGVACHSEALEEIVAYRAEYGECDLWECFLKPLKSMEKRCSDLSECDQTITRGNAYGGLLSSQKMYTSNRARQRDSWIQAA